MIYRSVFLLALAFVSTKCGPLFDPCHKDDMKCVERATQSFLSKTYMGAKDYGIQAVDPLVIPSLEIVADEDMGLVFYFKNIKVTGLKNLQMSDFKMDIDKKTSLLKMKGSVVINSDFKVGLTKAGKTFDGTYTSAGTVYGTSQYGYDIKEVNGVEHFEVGPETNSCEIFEDPQVTLGGDIENTLSKDENAVSLKGEWETKKSAIRKRVLCEIVKSGLGTVIQNLRTAAAAFPKTAFFIDM